MKPTRKPDSRKAQIQTIATVCLGTLFVVLLVKTLAGKGKAGGPSTRAVAARSATEEVEIPKGMPGTEPVVGVPDDGPLRYRLSSMPDTAAIEPPPDPFKMSPRLKEELTGVRQTRKPPATPAQKPRIKFKLQGIVADLKNGEHVALIDDELLRVGDVHRGYSVLEITRTQAILDNGTDRRVLRLEEK